jgi:hypothetical protein
METSQQIHKRFVSAYNDFMFENPSVKPMKDEEFETFTLGAGDPLAD